MYRILRAVNGVEAADNKSAWIWAVSRRQASEVRARLDPFFLGIVRDDTEIGQHRQMVVMEYDGQTIHGFLPHRGGVSVQVCDFRCHRLEFDRRRAVFQDGESGSASFVG